jgi:hypothetical protein
LMVNSQRSYKSKKSKVSYAEGTLFGYLGYNRSAYTKSNTERTIREAPAIKGKNPGWGSVGVPRSSLTDQAATAIPIRIQIILAIVSPVFRAGPVDCAGVFIVSIFYTFSRFPGRPRTPLPRPPERHRNQDNGFVHPASRTFF